ncbi:MAG: hypothetical protein V3T02_04965, partial [Alphaproteobacteria bacterium]
MSDIALSRTLPASAVAGTTAGSTAATASAAVSNLPTAIANLAVSTLIEGVVVERTGKNTVVVRTNNGTLTLHTALLLKPGSEVKLQVQTLGPQMRVVIVAIDGKPLSGAGPAASVTNPSAATVATPEVTTGPQPGTGSAGSAPSTQTPGAAPAGAGSAMAGTATASSPPLTSVNGPLTPGMTVVATVVQPAGAQPWAPGPAVLLMAENFTAAGREAPAPSTVPTATVPAAAAPSSNLAAGSQIVVRIAAIGGAAASSLTATASPATPAVAAADVLTIHGAVTNPASAVNNTAPSVGSTVVQTPLGLVSLPTTQPLPANTPLTLEILGTFADRSGREAVPGLVRQQTLHAFSKTWSALREAINTVRPAEAETGGQTFVQAIPRLGPTLANGILFFIAALRTGNVRSWLGDGALDALETAGRGDLSTQLGNDFALLGRIAGEHQESGWQTMLIPVYDGDKLHQIRMFMRKHGRHNTDDGETEARFVIETELSRLGLIQLDGLINKTQFDLVIRSRNELPGNIQTDIKAIFQDALVSAELGGSIKFQIKPDFEFSPPEDMAEGVTDHGVG